MAAMAPAQPLASMEGGWPRLPLPVSLFHELSLSRTDTLAGAATVCVLWVGRRGEGGHAGQQEGKG